MSEETAAFHLPVPEEMIRCAVCTTDLCESIYVCGNGHHHYCSKCIDKLPPRDLKPPKAATIRTPPPFALFFDDDIIELTPSPIGYLGERSDRSSPDLREFLQELETTSGFFERKDHPQAITIPIEETPEEEEEEVNVIPSAAASADEIRHVRRERRRRLKRRRTDDEEDNHSRVKKFFCAMCASNLTYTRVKWLENALSNFATVCTNPGCTERVWKNHLEEHLKSCRFRSFACPLCVKSISSFDADIIRKHFEHDHGMEEARISNTRFDLSAFEREGDCLYYHTTFENNSLSGVQPRQLFVFLRMHSRQPNGERVVGVTACDLTERSVTPGRELIMHLRANNCHSSSPLKQNQYFVVKFQPYVDNMQLNVYCIALLSNSDLCSRQ